jgi:hypothetical protein
MFDVSYGHAPPKKEKHERRKHPCPQQKTAKTLRISYHVNPVARAAGEDGGAIPAFFCFDSIARGTVIVKCFPRENEKKFHFFPSLA